MPGSMLWSFVVMTLGLFAAAAAAQEGWSPAPGPLMTRWAADVDPQDPLPEYPRPQLVRERWMNLNGLWQFAPAAEGDEAPFGRELERSILVPFPVESALSGIGERHVRVWYRRTFAVPAAWRQDGSRVLLHFGAVDWESSVFVNGRKVGEHRGGYDPFTVDITDALGDGHDVELVVGVWDPTDAGEQPRGKQVRKPGGIYYTPTTGIWQTVWLEPVPTRYIRDLRITPDVDGNRVRVSMDWTQISRSSTAEIAVYDGERLIGRAERGPAGPDEVEIEIADPKLWSPESPHLYTLRARLVRSFPPDREPSVEDEVASYFAMRKIEVGPDERGATRIKLNGQPYFGVGLLDQGFWPDGLYTAPTDEALRYDIEETKRLGFNTIRKHVKVEPARWYYWADRLGVLVWQDMPSGGASIGPKDPDLQRTPEAAAQYEAELRAMIRALHNHPSIIMWVVFNEGWGQFDTPRITALAKDLDPTRLVSNASGWADRGVGDIFDWHIYPGPGSPNPEPARAAVLGEFGGLGLPVKGHTWEEKAWGYQGTSSAEELTDRYVELLRGVWQLKDSPGLSAAIYTQTTDVETECNGLITYDRAVVKVDASTVARANAGQFPRIRTVEPVATERPLEWRYTFEPPAEGWERPAFDDSSWRRGLAGFGTTGTPGAAVGTEWSGERIWLRRDFDLAGDVPADLRLRIHHDEDAVVYLNGVKAAELKGYTTSYGAVRISPEARAALRPGRNVMAVHCRQTRGGQYIDVGLVEVGD